MLYFPIVEFALVNVATMTWLFKVFVSSLNLLEKQIVLAKIIEITHASDQGARASSEARGLTKLGPLRLGVNGPDLGFLVAGLWVGG